MNLSLSRLKKYLTRRFNDYQVRSIVKDYRKDHAAELNHYDQVIQKYRTAGGFSVNESIKLVALNKILETRKPKSILELGTGMTSVVFFRYANKYNASFTGMDEDAYWLENSKKLCEYNAATNPNVKFVHAPRKIMATKPVGISQYDYPFQEKYDLVFIDGPSTIIEGVLGKENYNSDIFEIVKVHYPETLVVDSRRATVDEMIKRIGDRYTIALADHWQRDSKLYKQDEYNHFSVFSKK